MKRTIAALLCACLTLSLYACSAPQQGSSTSSAQPQESSQASDASAQETGYPLTITDSLGNELTLEQPPQRVAALLGSYAEAWILAGGGEQLVAVTQDAYDERGLELGDEVTNLGTNNEPNLEDLFAAQPDLVILTTDLDGQLALGDSLAAAGIPAAWFKVETFPDYLAVMKVFTDITGREDLYEENALSVQEQIDAVMERIPEDVHPTVLLLRAYSTGVRAKNSDSIAGAILSDLGCVNIADSDSGLLEELQMESILAADPDYIFVTTMGSSTEKALQSLDDLFNSDPAWQSLTAIQEDRVHVLDKQLFHYKPNARWGESYEVLADILYPQA